MIHESLTRAGRGAVFVRTSVLVEPRHCPMTGTHESRDGTAPKTAGATAAIRRAMRNLIKGEKRTMRAP